MKSNSFKEDDEISEMKNVQMKKDHEKLLKPSPEEEKFEQIRQTFEDHESSTPSEEYVNKPRKENDSFEKEQENVQNEYLNFNSEEEKPDRNKFDTYEYKQ